MTAADALRDPDKIRSLAYHANVDRRLVVDVLRGNDTKQRASGGRARVRAAMLALGVEAPRPAEPPVLVSVKG